MRLAITGGTGFVGSHVIDAALAAGHEVRALTRREQPPRERLAWVAGSLDDRAAYFSHPDWVVTSGRFPPPELWHPRTETNQGLAATARWYEAQGWL